MNYFRFFLLTGLLLGSAPLLSACGSDDPGTQKAGNAENCGKGETCKNDCSANDNSCEMNCSADAHCEATCHKGQSCSFACADTATCKFDCREGECTVNGRSPNCSCQGNCEGICGKDLPGGGNDLPGGAGGTGTDW